MCTIQFFCVLQCHSAVLIVTSRALMCGGDHDGVMIASSNNLGCLPSECTQRAEIQTFLSHNLEGVGKMLRAGLSECLAMAIASSSAVSWGSRSPFFDGVSP